MRTIYLFICSPDPLSWRIRITLWPITTERTLEKRVERLIMKLRGGGVSWLALLTPAATQDRTLSLIY